MKRSETITVVCALGGILFGTGIQAVGTDAKDNSYKVIIDRNVFGLKTPVLIPETNTTPTNLPANQIQLAGITTIISPKRAILQWKDAGQAPGPGRHPVPGKEQSYIMVEGQREGTIEVIEINEKAGSVKIKNAGEPMLLTFETHGVKLPNTPPAVAQPGAVPNPVGAVPTGVGGTVPPNANASLHPGAPGYRPVGANPNPSFGGVNPAGSGLTSVPSRPIRSSSYTPPAIPQQPPIAPEAQIILMEAHRKQLQDQGDSTAGIIPPTELTEQLNPPQ